MSTVVPAPRRIGPPIEFVSAAGRLYGVDRYGNVMVFRLEDSPSPRHRASVRFFMHLFAPRSRRRRSSHRVMS